MHHGGNCLLVTCVPIEVEEVESDNFFFAKSLVYSPVIEFAIHTPSLP